MWFYVATLLIIWAVGWFIRDHIAIGNPRNKYVFITGCDTGFGNLLAKRLDKRGFRVLAGCFTQKGADDLQRGTSSMLKTILLDVTKSDSIVKAANWVRSEVGDKGLWGLVNNAGRAIPIGPTEWMRIDDFQKVLSVNLMGMIEVSLTFLPLVKKAKGRIVNTSSVLGRIAANGGAYCLSKYGVESFSDSLRRDMFHFGVRVALIEPGFFKTAVTSLEPIEKDLNRLWNQLSSDVRESYGQHYFGKYIKVQRFYMNHFCDTDLSKVTSCMEHALMAKYPRTRYSPGWDAKLLWIPLSYAPACVADMLLVLLLPKPARSSH
ncbi:retinol dehydrogenase 5 [Latimeria chalumnae]|uniref:retinol dehydrogenase 5 n=1 Tax=Latimeria chalumnae TaxID=7897 RepID=UPI00313C91E4